MKGPFTRQDILDAGQREAPCLTTRLECLSDHRDLLQFRLLAEPHILQPLSDLRRERLSQLNRHRTCRASLTRPRDSKTNIGVRTSSTGGPSMVQTNRAWNCGSAG